MAGAAAYVALLGAVTHALLRFWAPTCQPLQDGEIALESTDTFLE